ncbi:MAG TPA: helix-turn-helix domain-containing protein [Actinomycetota bacterium]|nr:helix-turn-helix domain-containing protein [Actinomycetota bacterium]
MSTAATELLTHRALAGESRARLLDALRRADPGLDASELAAAVALHVSTVRFHLRALEAAGLVLRAVERSGRPGRPRVVYRATSRRGEDDHRYLRLARALAASLRRAGPDASRAALEAGREWGREAASAAGAGPRSGDDAVRALLGMLEEMGFAPEAARGEGSVTIRLRRCPFLEVAREASEVVCPVHLGIMRGALSAWRSDVRAVELLPFAQPGLCVSRLSTSPRGATSGV